MSEYKDLKYEEKNGVAKILINRPDKMNAFRAETCEELLHALNRAGWNNDIGVVVLGGAGDRAFVPVAINRPMVKVMSLVMAGVELSAFL